MPVYGHIVQLVTEGINSRSQTEGAYPAEKFIHDLTYDLLSLFDLMFSFFIVVCNLLLKVIYVV